MTKKLMIIVVLVLLSLSLNSFADLFNDFSNFPGHRHYKYLEEFYGLYQKRMIANNDDRLERIRLLHLAIRAPFAHPVRALARCKNPAEQEKYQYLMYMHICFLLTKEYTEFGQRFDMKNIYWYNKEWKDKILESFVIAKEAYENARMYFHKAKIFAKMCIERSDIYLEGPEMDRMQDVAYRIVSSTALSQYSEDNINHYQRERYIDYNYDRILDERIYDLERKSKELEE